MPLRLDPLVSLPPPLPAATEADMRMADVQMAFDVCREAMVHHRGARRRVAQKHGIQPSTVTECLKRVDRALGAPLFDTAHSRPHALTPAGDAFVESASMFLRSYQVLRRHVQRAIDGI